MTDPSGRFVKAAGAAFVLFGIVACTTVAPVAPQVERRVGENPKPGESATVRVGEAIYTKYDYRVSSSPVLQETFSRSYLLGQIYIPAGTALFPKPRRSGGMEYCTASQTYSGGGRDITCFVGPPNASHFSHLRVPSLKYGSFTQLKNPVPYKVQESMAGEGLKMEILYQGVADGVLRLSYREFSENLARPAFQQELTYTLGDDGQAEVSFRSLKIEVIGADNSEIEYRVTHGLY